jgi:hypothetical protein
VPGAAPKVAEGEGAKAVGARAPYAAAGGEAAGAPWVAWGEGAEAP